LGAVAQLGKTVSSSQLRCALHQLLQSNLYARGVCGIIWALAKSGDRAYVPEIAAQLRRGLQLLLDGNALLFHALCSLEDLGEHVYERDQTGRSSQSVDEVGKNVRQARAYLEKHGILLPW
jgi:hypothetical protein